MGAGVLAVITITPGIIQEMVDRIVRDFDPVKVILFGSQARGEGNRDSDVDLLVVLDEIDDKMDAAVAIMGVLREVRVPNDIIVTTPEEIARRGHIINTVLRWALRDGRVMYERG